MTMLAAVTVAAHVEMEMIIMRGVVVGSEHCAEAEAARFVQRAQEILRRHVAVPPAVEHDAAAVGVNEARYVDREIGIASGRERVCCTRRSRWPPYNSKKKTDYTIT